MKKISLFIGLALVAQLAFGASFEKDATVVFLGDSITHQAHWTSFITRYYFEWMPERNVTFYNAGVGGDTMGGCQRRLHEDVNARKPSVIVTMFGMNDVGGALWAEKFGEKENARKKEILARYEKNLQALAARLKKDNPKARLVWCTPSIYDETVALKNRPANLGRNRELLAGCADIVKRFGAANGDEVIDFHGPMNAFNAERQKVDPTFTIVGGDRVHPGAAGGFFMACAFLRQQGLDPHVGKDPLTPWRQTDLSKKLNAMRGAEGVLRELACERWFLTGNKIDPDNLKAVQIFADTLREKGRKGYFEGLLPKYLERWPKHAEYEKTFMNLQNEAKALAKLPRLAVFGGSFSVVAASRVAKDAWRKEIGCMVDDYGIGGCGFKAGDKKTNDVPNQVARALDTGLNYAGFVLWSSTNDIWSKEPNFQNDGIERTVALIRKRAPQAKIFFFTSMPVPLKPEMNELLGIFVSEQIKTCKKLGVTYLDLYHQSDITAENGAGFFTKDKVHPNEAGYAKVKDIQIKYLKSGLGRLAP